MLCFLPEYSEYLQIDPVALQDLVFGLCLLLLEAAPTIIPALMLLPDLSQEPNPSGDR